MALFLCLFCFKAPAKRVQHFIKHHIISVRPVNKEMWRENCFHCPPANRTEYKKVAWGGQTSTTIYNILKNKRNVVSYNICSVKKFDSDQTLYNKIQHDTTRYNKVAKRVQPFHTTSKLYNVV